MTVFFVIMLLWPYYDCAQALKELCPIGQTCVSLESCDRIMAIIEKSRKLPYSSDVRTRMKDWMKTRICGGLTDWTVCCDLENDEEHKRNLTKLGSFSTIHYGVSGDVYEANSSTILLKNFKYKGGAPAAYFVVGSSGKPDNQNADAILPYPFEGKHYSYSEPDIPDIPSSAAEDENIRLVLPPHIKVNQLTWLSVFCRTFNVDFGHCMFKN